VHDRADHHQVSAHSADPEVGLTDVDLPADDQRPAPAGLGVTVRSAPSVALIVALLCVGLSMLAFGALLMSIVT